jgi:hypothetical protein
MAEGGMAPLLWVASAIGSALIGLLLTILFQDRVSLVIAKLLQGRWLGEAQRDLSGTWHTYYSVIRDDGLIAATSSTPAYEVVWLRQVGGRVTGTSANKSLRDFIVIATFHDNSYLTGTWRNTKHKRHYWGGFQLHLLANGYGMVGRFVGKDSNNRVNHGIWLWARNNEGLHKVAEWAVQSGGYALSLAALKSSIDATVMRELH